MRNILKSSVAAAVGGVLAWAGSASGQTVPVAETPPTSCTTPTFSVSVQVNQGVANPAQCGAQACDEYVYTVTSASYSIDHTVVAVSASQKVLSTLPGSTIAPLGVGDSATGFLKYADHEYPVRFNCSAGKSEVAKMYLPAGSKPRIGTVLVRSGTKKTESCLIATPGVAPTNPQFQPVYVTQKLLVAGGKCIADLIYDQTGQLVDVQLAAENTNPDCRAGQPSDGVVLVNGEPLQNNVSPLGITFGTNTTTCYGPPVPSIPRCICTKAPCP